MRFRALLLSAAFLVLPCTAQEIFIAKPYLQLGDNPADATRLTLLWQTPEPAAKYTVQVMTEGAKKWSKAQPAEVGPVTSKGVDPHLVYTATLTKLKPGQLFEYRVLRNGRQVFNAQAMSRKDASQPFRVAIFGDCGQNNQQQREIARQTIKQNPDWVMIPGDIVYTHGQITEYRKKFYPIYNNDQAGPEGGPLMRSRLFVGVPGNHDVATGDFTKYPDAQGYFLYWNQPLNGPALSPNGPNVVPFTGDEDAQKRFLNSAGKSFPRMLNYSFDYGNSHWTMLDGNDYVDWHDPKMQQWVEDDLKAASKATWRFVGVHQPGFNSSKAHFEQQQLRWLAPLFEKYGVDVVFAGHVHNYQRTYPMRFQPTAAGAKKIVNGKWTLDKMYDGLANTKPDGVIYVITGAGGAALYNPDQEEHHETWQEFTYRFLSSKHSLSIVDVNGGEFKFRQLDANGDEMDSFRIVK